MPSPVSLVRRARAGLIRRTVRRFPGLLRLRRLDSDQAVQYAVARTATRLQGRSGLASWDAALAEGRQVAPVFTEVTEHIPPGPDVVFATVCTDKFAPGLEALILSLRQVYPGLDHRFVVYHDGALSPFVQQRLASIYPRFEFEQRTTDRYRVVLGTADNHRRVGLLGYLSLEALQLTDASHVVILDSDLLVLGDISPLWTGDTICAVPDIGQRPWGAVSRATGRPVINSGVLSFPRHELGRTAEIQAALDRVSDETDPDLAPFADQKFWNLYLADRDVTLLPQNYNTIKNLLRLSYPGEIGNVSVLHYSGPKPWLPFAHPSLVTEIDRADYSTQAKELEGVFTLWRERYYRGLMHARLTAFRRDMSPKLDAIAGSSAGRPAVLIGNGPSLAATDLGDFAGFHTVAFNWFVHHDDFDEVAVDDLIVPSHMLFGGWGTPHPVLPAEWLDALTAHAHRPRLWFSYFFKPYLETLPQLAGYDLNYLLLEKPLRRRITDTGAPGLALDRPLVDANTGVLTAGVPLALHVGASAIVLTGCDSNYASARGSYFYARDRHASAATDEAELVKTWVPGGEGPYGYEVTKAALDARGVPFADATVGGALTMLPRLDPAGVRALVG